MEGGQYTTPAGRQEELIAHRKLVGHMQIGTTSEFPSDMRYNTWSPQEDPSVVVGADGSVTKPIRVKFGAKNQDYLIKIDAKVSEVTHG